MAQPTLTPREQRLAFVAPNSRIGAGLLQWSKAGWFGAQFGSTLWLGLCGGAVLGFDPSVGLMILGCCLLANVVGFVLWRKRASVAPHLAIQLLCAASFCAAAGSFALLYKIGIAGEIADSPEGGLPFPLWVYLAIYPVLSVGLAFLDRRGKEAS